MSQKSKVVPCASAINETKDSYRKFLSICSAKSARSTNLCLRALQRVCQFGSSPLPCSHTNSTAFMRSFMVGFSLSITLSSAILRPSANPRSSHIWRISRTDVRTLQKSFSPNRIEQNGQVDIIMACFEGSFPKHPSSPKIYLNSVLVFFFKGV